VGLKEKELQPIISCGSLMTPIHGRKSTFFYTPGTQVDFDCDPDFILIGERRRVCQANGEWNIPRGGQDGRTETEWANWNPAKTTRCIEAGEHESVSSAKTAGIILGIIIPLLLLALFLTLCYRRRKHAHEINSVEDYNRGRPQIELSKNTIEPKVVVVQQQEGEHQGSPTSKKETSA